MNNVIQSAIETLQDAIKRAIDQVRITADKIDQTNKEYLKLAEQQRRELARLEDLERALDVLEAIDLEEGE